MVRKGRHLASRPRGEQHRDAKLTEGDVASIRDEYATGTVTQKDLSEKYGIAEPGISRIINLKSWKHTSDGRVIPSPKRILLTAEQVRQIRNDKAQGLTQREVAEKHGISQPSVHNIVSRKNWGNIE